ncbi:hypothetical protein [Ectothiorhodospira shaposhnikovii]|uniref:hypothetical protein n=1 Tax=Ectothiorhodospira shaposhnikovii TaxID=1054 RepID=UPI001EE82520|nr:hypothetical protein [Ectothiorhodospira shaposhnikovii]MCG5512880.1 hypothetical protein [Ectothiorhodospira shaposhnikovii]
MVNETQENAVSVDQSVGNGNVHIHWCDALNQRRFYGSCLVTLEAWKKGEVSTDAEKDVRCDCAGAMNRNNCSAMKLRQEELTAGKAIYFKPLKRLEGMPALSMTVDRTSPGFIRGWNAAGSDKSLNLTVPGQKTNSDEVFARKPVPRPEPKVPTDDGYAGLINTMMKEAEGGPATPVELKVEEKPPVQVAAALKPQTEKSVSGDSFKKPESMLEKARRMAAERRLANGQ